MTDKFTLKLHVQKKIQRNQELEEKVEATTYLTSLFKFETTLIHFCHSSGCLLGGYHRSIQRQNVMQARFLIAK